MSVMQLLNSVIDKLDSHHAYRYMLCIVIFYNGLLLCETTTHLASMFSLKYASLAA